MIRNLSLSVFFFLISVSAFAQHKNAESVNVFTGTSNSRWMMYPGATLPFGMVKLSPDNQGNVWNGGYEYTVQSISGFSHLHAMSLSGLSLMPVSGPLVTAEGWTRVYPGSSDGPFGTMWTSGFRSRFRKETEKGSPGYYAVHLLDHDVHAELSATLRCGIMRFGYPSGKSAHLVLNFDPETEEKTEVTESFIEQISTTRYRGYVRQRNQYAPEYRLYFVLESSAPVLSMDAWETEAFQGKENNYGIDWRKKRSFRRGLSDFKGQAGSGVVFNMDTVGGRQIVFRSALSFVSMEQAQLNMDAELKTDKFEFNKVAMKAGETWNGLLSAIDVHGSSAEKRELFYTNLYR
jgi:putative alpha-1,2-mannosidase